MGKVLLGREHEDPGTARASEHLGGFGLQWRFTNTEIGYQTGSLLLLRDEENSGFLRLQSQGPSQAQVGNPSKSLTSALPSQVCELSQEQTLSQLGFLLEGLTRWIRGKDRGRLGFRPPQNRKLKSSNVGGSSPTSSERLTPPHSIAVMTRPHLDPVQGCWTLQ